MLYVQVERALFNENSIEFKVSKTPEKVEDLPEAGFEHVCEKDGLMFFRMWK